MSPAPRRGVEARLIGELRAQGMTQREIGRAIGRSPSYVSKVERGVKPGGGLADSLRALAGGAPSAPAPRRTRSDGTVARYRGAPTRSAAPLATSRGSRTDTGAGVLAGLDPGGFSGSYGTDGARWSLHSWRDGDGWHEIGAGDTPSARDLGDTGYILIEIEGVGYRQFRVEFTDDFDFYDAIAEALDAYGTE